MSRLLRRVLGPRRFLAWILRLYPPYLGAGIRVRRVAPDLASFEVDMPLRFYNRNYFGTHFGGSLYAMCDPFFALILVERLGKAYVVWDRSASIRFRRPGRGTVRAVFTIDDETVAAIRQRADEKGRTLEAFTVDVVDGDGKVVAQVEKVVHVRRKDG